MRTVAGSSGPADSSAPSLRHAADALRPPAETPELPAEIELLRRSIDNVDAALVYLLAERFALTGRVGEIKAEHGLPPADQARDDAQIARIKQIAALAGLEPEFAEAFREFVVAEVIRRHRRTAELYEAGESAAAPLPLDTFA